MGIRCSSLQELNIFRFSHTLGEGVHARTSGPLALTNTERGNIYERLHKQFSLGTITNCKSEDAPWLQCPTDKALCNTTSLKKNVSLADYIVLLWALPSYQHGGGWRRCRMLGHTLHELDLELQLEKEQGYDNNLFLCALVSRVFEQQNKKYQN